MRDSTAARFLSFWLAAVVLFPVGTACRDDGAVESDPASVVGDLEDADGPRHHSSLPAEFGVTKPWTGDLNGMIEREYIRALVVSSKTQYFLDGGTQRGLTYEALKEFESFLNKRLGRRTLPVHVVILPVERHELIPALVQGLGDLAVANLTVTAERQQKVDFSNPMLRDVSEVVVTGPKAPQLENLDSLAGETVHARPSSSYWDSLEAVSLGFRERGLDPIDLEPAADYLEDEDLLELVNVGLLPMAVVDIHKAQFWAQVFPDIEVREDLAVRTGGDIAWAFRKASPQLAEVVNAFMQGHKKGTLFGNVIFKRYLSDLDWVIHPDSEKGDERFAETIALFRTYGERYDFDPLILAAVGYQESHLDQSKRSSAGAVGVMQIKPATAADKNVGVSDIGVLENNIHAGTKYLAFIRDRYFSDPGIDPLDRVLLTLAAYNAGPARVRSLRAEASESGLDPNRWYRNVEVVAARRIGRETVRYVSNITKYWIAYSLEADRAARAEN